MFQNKTLGFIVLRHVNTLVVNQYWIKCIEHIRKFYPENHILIIDDNSNEKYILPVNFKNTTIINSEFHGRGEFLPYYYYLKNKLFDCAVIIHDSIFIQQKMDFFTDTYKPIWHFPHNASLKTHINDIIKMLSLYELDKKYVESNCEGRAMTSISHDFLTNLNKQYDLSKLINYINCRYDRCAFERVLGFLCMSYENSTHNKKSMLGDILKYCKWGITFSECEKYPNLPILKVWTGR